MGKPDPAAIPLPAGTIHPPPSVAGVAGRRSQRLGDAGGLTQFGVALVTRAPGAKSAMRHRHRAACERVTRGAPGRPPFPGAPPTASGGCAAPRAAPPDAPCRGDRGAVRRARGLAVGARSARGRRPDPDRDPIPETDGAARRHRHAHGRPRS